MSKRKKLIIISSVAVLLVVLGLLIVWQFKQVSQESLLQETPGLPESEWPRKIEVQDTETGFRIISNYFDKYRITIPAFWSINEDASFKGGFKSFSGITTGGDVAEGLILEIYAFEDQSQAETYFPSSARFTEITINKDLKGFRTSYKMTRDQVNVDTGEIRTVAIENSAINGYIFHDDKKIYLIFCKTLGEDFNESLSQCEKQVVETFTILD